MLLQLNIKNFALIEELTISFKKGFNVLSGETGAGKSILIDAINYVLGGKFNKDLIRTGTDKTFVEAIFVIENGKTKKALVKQEIDYEDLVIISRETFQSGKSIAKVNGKSILLSKLREISSTLIDIHGQHENQNLLEASNHINYLDYFANSKMTKLLHDYKINYEKLKELRKKILGLTGENGEREKNIDFLKYQINEINDCNLKAGEEEELESQYNVLSNAEKISKVLSSSYEILYGGSEDTISICDNVGYVVRELRTIESHIEKLKAIADSMEEVYYTIQENIEEIRNMKENIQYDEDELNCINSRMFQIANMKKKYGNSIKEILQYKDKITEKYEELINSNEVIEKLRLEEKKTISELKSNALRLHDLRCEAANILENKVKEELSYIGMGKSTFKINIDLKEEFDEEGLDKVNFLISTNPGEPMKNLEKVVSGGELSRIMLALKTVFVDKDMIPSIIFDEIDTGISGRIAQSVAEKMYIISNKHQVFCVTHLPQIACMSDTHYLVSKEVKKEKTFTNIYNINNEEKKLEIARMIGSAKVTDLTIKNAEEMIKLANIKKEEMIKNG